MKQKEFFCFCTSDTIQSIELVINRIQANFSPGWYYPGNTQKLPFAGVSQNVCS